MKHLLALVIAATFTAGTFAADEAAKPETKKVCIEQKDAKTGKMKEVCKTVKVHKKHEGTKVPDGKKK
jgi:Ni/Co efflux regulator RcnB